MSFLAWVGWMLAAFTGSLLASLALAVVARNARPRERLPRSNETAH